MTPEAKAAYLRDPAECAPIAAGSAAEIPTSLASAAAAGAGALRTSSAAAPGIGEIASYVPERDSESAAKQRN